MIPSDKGAVLSSSALFTRSLAPSSDPVPSLPSETRYSRSRTQERPRTRPAQTSCPGESQERAQQTASQQSGRSPSQSPQEGQPKIQ
ncbi:hypothetical protein BDW60DRAFT_176979 [Aspergillus nidulans var. acristatus]